MKTQNKSSRSSTKATFVQVARLYYEDNLSQQEIANRLGVSRALINLYLKNAREEGIVRVQIIDPTNNCIQLATDLKKLIAVENITVVPNPRGAQSLSLRAVAGVAADHISATLSDNATLGLCWGRTAAAVTEMLKPTRARNVDAVPLLGDTGHTVVHSQMNQLVMQAAQRLGVKAHFLSLPMIVSSAELRDALLKEDGIRDILKKWDHLTIACMGIGTVPPTPGMFVYMGEQILPNLIKSGAVGDLCGIYYDRQGHIIPSGLENRKIAVTVDQLQAAGSIVAFASGDDRALAVLGVMRTGLVSSLFIDQSLAERILAEISAEKTTATR